METGALRYIQRQRVFSINCRDRCSVLPLFTPVVVNVVLQVQREVDHPDLKKRFKAL